MTARDDGPAPTGPNPASAGPNPAERTDRPDRATVRPQPRPGGTTGEADRPAGRPVRSAGDAARRAGGTDPAHGSGPVAPSPLDEALLRLVAGVVRRRDPVPERVTDAARDATEVPVGGRPMAVVADDAAGAGLRHGGGIASGRAVLRFALGELAVDVEVRAGSGSAVLTGLVSPPDARRVVARWPGGERPVATDRYGWFSVPVPSGPVCLAVERADGPSVTPWFAV